MCVPARLLDKAQQEGEKNTQRHEVDGKIVLVTERRVVDQVSIYFIYMCACVCVCVFARCVGNLLIGLSYDCNNR